MNLNLTLNDFVFLCFYVFMIILYATVFCVQQFHTLYNNVHGQFGIVKWQYTLNLTTQTIVCTDHAVNKIISITVHTASTASTGEHTKTLLNLF